MKKALIFLIAAVAFFISCSQVINPEGIDKEVVATSIKLNKNELTINKGQSETLSVSFIPSNVTDKSLIWASSNNSIVTVSDGKVTAVAPGTADITVHCGNASDKCSITVIVDASSITLNTQSAELLVGETIVLTATVEPEETTESLVWESSSESIVTVKDGVVKAVALGEATVTAKAGSKNAECKILVKEQECPAGAVDMNVIVTREDGSTYKLFIAKCNLGANSPEEIGDYYAWGEVETKDSYVWETYKWRKEGSSMDVKKYGYNPDLDIYSVVLEPEDDVAQVKLGGRWRMPTFEELEALMRTIGNTSFDENYSAEWKTVNGSWGVEMIYTPNGNSVFFPATGIMNGSKISESSKNQVYFWSSSAANYENDSTQAWYMSMKQKQDYTSVGHYTWGKNGGMPIRPVSE